VCGHASEAELPTMKLTSRQVHSIFTGSSHPAADQLKPCRVQAPVTIVDCSRFCVMHLNMQRALNACRGKLAPGEMVAIMNGIYRISSIHIVLPQCPWPVYGILLLQILICGLGIRYHLALRLEFHLAVHSCAAKCDDHSIPTQHSNPCVK